MSTHPGAMPRELKLPGHRSTLSSFLAGMARLFDFWGLFTAHDLGHNGKVTDSQALSSDWRAVGHDIHKAVRSYARELR